MKSDEDLVEQVPEPYSPNSIGVCSRGHSASYYPRTLRTNKTWRIRARFAQTFIRSMISIWIIPMVRIESSPFCETKPLCGIESVMPTKWHFGTIPAE